MMGVWIFGGLKIMAPSISSISLGKTIATTLEQQIHHTAYTKLRQCMLTANVTNALVTLTMPH
jgi:hypothetical protein